MDNKNKNQYSCGLVTFEQFNGKRKNWAGSSRIRGEWLIKHWDGAELFCQGKEYDVVIYQKAYWIEHAQVFNGVKILDMCDPDWLRWECRVKEMIELVDAITTSTEALANYIRKLTDKPVLCVPDRIDLDFYQVQKHHEGDAKWVVWFGYSSNFELVKPVLHFLKKLHLNLIVISDRDFDLPITAQGMIELKNVSWELETINQDILQADIVINPISTIGKWKYKSNNKTVAGWALGMPVAHDVDDLQRFISVEERIREVKERLIEVGEKYDVRLSVKEYQELIDKILEARKSEQRL